MVNDEPWAFRMMDRFGGWFMGIALVFCVGLSLCFIGMIGVAALQWAFDDEPIVHIGLRHWDCTASEQVFVPSKMAGKTLIHEHYETVCNQYTRR